MTPLALALNSALLHLLWQGVVVAFLLWIALAALRKSSANARYIVSCAVLALLAVLPLVTAWVAYTRPIAPQRVPMVRVPIVRVPIALPVTALVPPIPARFDWLALAQTWMVPAWACGVLILSIRLLCGCAKVSTLKRTGDAAEPFVLAMIARLSERVGVTRSVRVLISSLTDGPSVIGALRPVILLPAATLLGLAPAQLEAVLAHELAHIRRFDYLVNIVQMLIETLFFYHPAVWWISSRIREERELCCDDIAVRCCGDAVGYARALTAIERIRVMTHSNEVPSLALGVKDGPLMYRIQRLLGATPREQALSRLPGVFAILLAIVCFSTDMNPVKAQAPLPQLPAPPSAPVVLTPQPQRPARTLIQMNRAFQTVPFARPLGQVPKSDGAVTVEVTIGQNGEVTDARVVSGPMGERRSALLTALGMRFPLQSASTTRQMEIFSDYPAGGAMAVFSLYSPAGLNTAANTGMARILTPAIAQERLTTAYRQIEKLKALQAEASERGAAQLQEAIDSYTRGLDDLRQAASGQNPLVGKTLENIVITGVQVSYAARDELRAQLPVRLHDVLTEENMAAAVSTVKGVYPYADAYFGTSGSGQAGFLVTVPVR
jgi:beta-lactamase regulating signal transducer with metallopeptidase domain